MTTRHLFGGGAGKQPSSMRRAAAFAIAAVALLAAAPAHAIIVYEDPGRLTAMPVLAGGVKPGWQYMGNTEGFGGIPIGPRAWVAASHTVGSGTTRFVYDNAGLTSSLEYSSTRVAMSGDLSVMVLNDGQPDFLAWAPVWADTASLSYGQGFYMYGYGLLRGSAITNDVPAPNTQKGWYWGDYNFALSYGTNNLEGTSNDGFGHYLFVMYFDQPTVQNGLPGTEGMYSLYDSGGGVFSYNAAHARWELIGINSAIQEVSATAGGPNFGAALYDARGFYDGNTQITGTVNYPLRSFATALPYQYDLLAPYIAEVPEPATWSLLGIAAALCLLPRARSRRDGPTNLDHAVTPVNEQIVQLLGAIKIPTRRAHAPKNHLAEFHR